MNDLILPRGSLICYRCGVLIDKCAQDKRRTSKHAWNNYCSLICFRRSQTKYVGLSAKERQKMYDKTSKLNNKNRIKIKDL